MSDSSEDEHEAPKESPAKVSAKKNFSLAYKLALVEVLAVQPHMSPERFQLSAALIVQSFIQEASKNGMERLDELTPEAILQLCPSPDTLGRSLEIIQHVLDDELEKEFDCEHARALFLIHDAGNKKKDKLQQRLLAAYDFKLKKVVLKHVAASKCAGAKNKIDAGAELTKEYLALELAQAGEPLLDTERHKNGDIKMKKGELIERLAKLKKGYVFERLVDAEGGRGGPSWLGGLGATHKISASSAARLVALRGGEGVQAATGDDMVDEASGGVEQGAGGGALVAEVDAGVAQEEAGGAVAAVRTSSNKKKGRGKGTGTGRRPTKSPAPKPKVKGVKRSAGAGGLSEQVPADNEKGSDKRSARSGRLLKSNSRFASGGDMDDGDDD